MNGRVVDAFFRAERVIVEIDSYEFHSDKPTFELDGEKDADQDGSHGLGTECTPSPSTCWSYRWPCRSLTRLLRWGAAEPRPVAFAP